MLATCGASSAATDEVTANASTAATAIARATERLFGLDGRCWLDVVCTASLIDAGSSPFVQNAPTNMSPTAIETATPQTHGSAVEVAISATATAAVVTAKSPAR